MVFFQWVVVLLCSMVSAVVLPALISTRVCDASSADPGNRGLRRWVLRLGVVADSIAAVFAGALLGVDWLPALAVGLLYFIGKLGLAEIWSRRIHPGPLNEVPAEEMRARDEAMRRVAENHDGHQGLAVWTGMALAHLIILILFLLPFRFRLVG